MKKWGFSALVLLLLITAMAAAKLGHNQSVEIPTIDDVVSATFSESVVLRPGDQVAQLLTAAEPEDRAVIEKVLGWVRSAKVVGKGQVPLPSMGTHVFVLHLNNNREFSVAEVRPNSALLWDSGDGNPAHLDSSDLSTWLWEGWKEDLRVEPYGQQVVDAVFSSIDLVVMPGFRDFPTTVGVRPGVINIGGPAPGQTIPATFETTVSELSGGRFQVEFIRRWGSGAHTTWTFSVDGIGTVQDQGRTGDEPPHIP